MNGLARRWSFLMVDRIPASGRHSSCARRRAALHRIGTYAGVALLGAAGCSIPAGRGHGPAGRRTDYEVAAYYWPNWHADARNAQWLGKGWTEWALVKAATPRFPGHYQPRVPLWGYQDEADPQVMARKIDAAANHGITAFIFDWYYYNEGPALERCLREGFLQAPNRGRLKFALMWANHDYVDLFPVRRGQPIQRWNAGAVTRATFIRATDRIIQDYFSQPNYWRIGGRPYFSIYQLSVLAEGLGGADHLRAALADFRARCRAAGLPGVHLNVVLAYKQWDYIRHALVPGSPDGAAATAPDAARFLAALGIDSVTSYSWLDRFNIPSSPSFPYAKMGAAAVAQWNEIPAALKLPFYPNVTVGWDSSPRTDQTQAFKTVGYPHLPVAVGGTPAAFREYLEQARAWLARRPSAQRILTINSWNEWTEGSYLEPDTVNKMKYLEAVQSVFPPRRSGAE